jgi:hypothetical protein
MKRKGSDSQTSVTPVTPAKSVTRGGIRKDESLAKWKKQKANERLNASLVSPTKFPREEDKAMPVLEITGGVSVELILGEKSTEQKFYIGDCVAVTRCIEDRTEPWDTMEPKVVITINCDVADNEEHDVVVDNDDS